MTIHKEGRKLLLICLLVFIVIIITTSKFCPVYTPIHYILYTLGLVVFLLLLNFFRYPKREPVLGDDHVLCPCDGKVVTIEIVEEPEYFKDKRIQISIFMSPLNVHANWYPIAGKVTYSKYHPGQYLVAWHPKSSTLNERTTVVVQHKNQQSVLFRQIAGALARRIMNYAKEGDDAKQGGEFGFIKFGSRVDVYLPLDANVKVAIGQVVKGQQTVIAGF